MDEETEDVTGPPDLFVGRDALESYMKECNYKPINPLDRYGTLILRITHGMELLPDYDNPDEKDEEQKKKNKIKQDEKDKLYKKAGETLKTEIPKKRKITYDEQGKTQVTIYLFSASDADDCECLDKDFEKMANNFTIQQHEQHISKLQEVHNQIYHVLIQTGIYPSINPTLEDMIKEQIKLLHREITDMMLEKLGEYKNGERKRKI